MEWIQGKILEQIFLTIKIKSKKKLVINANNAWFFAKLEVILVFLQTLTKKANLIIQTKSGLEGWITLRSNLESMMVTFRSQDAIFKYKNAFSRIILIMTNSMNRF